MRKLISVVLLVLASAMFLGGCVKVDKGDNNASNKAQVETQTGNTSVKINQ